MGTFNYRLNNRSEPINIKVYLLSFNYRISDLDLLVLMGDIFGAGSESSAATLRWAIIYMAINRKVESLCKRLNSDSNAENNLYI